MAKYVIDIPNDRISDFVGATHLLMPYTMAGHQGHHDTGLDLTPYTEPDEQEIREKAREEVWDFVFKFEGESEKINECFGMDSLLDVMSSMTYSEAKAKYEEWRKQKDEIRVGDEVTICGQKRVVTSIDEKDTMAIDSDGNTYGFRSIGFRDEATKTGKHFPEVAELLKKMREE